MEVGEYLFTHGDAISILYTPVNYTPVVAGGAFLTDTIRGHLEGIDAAMLTTAGPWEKVVSTLHNPQTIVRLDVAGDWVVVGAADISAGAEKFRIVSDSGGQNTLRLEAATDAEATLADSQLILINNSPAVRTAYQFLNNTQFYIRSDNDIVISNTTTTSGLYLEHATGQIFSQAIPNLISQPAFSFQGDQNTGYTRVSGAPDTTAIVTAGLEALRADSAQRIGINQPSPTSRLHVEGSIAFETRSVASIDSPVSLGDETTLLGDASAGPIVVGLPDASTVPDRIYIISKIDSSTGTVDINAFAGDTVRGSATALSLRSQYETVMVQSDGGTNWIVLGNHVGTIVLTQDSLDSSPTLTTDGLALLENLSLGGNEETAWRFEHNKDKNVLFNIPVPADYDITSGIDVEIIWMQVGGGAGNVIWRFGHKVKAAGVTHAAAYTTASTTIAVPSQNTHAVTNLGTTATPGSSLNDNVAIYIERNGQNASDTYNDFVYILAVRLTYPRRAY